MCGSDVQIINVPPGHPWTPPVIIGHEFVGWIRAAGSAVRDITIGSRVLVDLDPKCGTYDSCRSGRPANCTNIVALGVHRAGALAGYVTARPAARKGLAILGSYISSFTFPAAIRLVESGQLNLAPMITAIVPIDETLAGIARPRSGGAVKIVIKP